MNPARFHRDYSTSYYRQDTANPSDKAAKAGLPDVEGGQSVSRPASRYQTIFIYFTIFLIFILVL